MNVLRTRYQKEKREQAIKRLKEKIAYHKEKVWQLKGLLYAIKQT